jgi:HEAT repeat protein
MRVASLIGLASLLSTAAFADLDIAIPAGSPAEWIDYIPSVAPDTYRGSIPRKSAAEGNTIVADANPKKPEASSIFGYVKIISWDLPTHLNWWAELPKGPPEKTIPTGDGVKVKLAYPPDVPPDLFWLASSVFLRKLMHPGGLNDAESIQYLLYLGEPSLAAAEAAKGQTGAGDYIGAVTSAIKPLPGNPPAFDRGANEFENMMIRLVWEDLVTAFPLGLDQSFAGRIALLGEEPVRFVVRAAQSNHSFLRRNAVYQLGQYRSAEATEALRVAFADRDPVMRNRALEALAKRRDTTIVPDLIKRAKSGDKSFQPYAVYALGQIGSTDALPALHDLLKRNQGLSGVHEFDMATSTLIALARLKCGGDPDVVKTVEKLLAAAAKKQIPNPPAGLKADVPDPANVRGETVAQLATIALAFADPQRHGKAVLELVEAGKKQAPGDDPLSRIGARRLAGTLRAIHPMAVNVLVDVLPLVEGGRDLLKAIVSDAREDETVRAYAMYKLATATFDDLAEFAKGFMDVEKTPPSVGENALQALFRADRKAAAEAAREIIRQFLASPQPPPDGRLPRGVVRRIVNGKEIPPPPKGWTPHQRFVVALCVKLLGAMNETDPETLKKIIAREHDRRLRLKRAIEEDAKKPRQDPKEPGARRGFGSGIDPQDGLWQIEVQAPDRLLENSLIELGRLGKAEHIEVFRKILEDKELEGKVEACLALGAIATPEALALLVGALEHPEDGWLRYMAYRVLKDVTGQDFFCDWIYQSEEVRTAKAAEWRIPGR